MTQLFREPELRDLQLQITQLRATVKVLERTMAAHATLIARVQAEVLALKSVGLA